MVPNKQTEIETTTVNPNTAQKPGTFGQLCINITDGSVWRYTGAALPNSWAMIAPPIAAGGGFWTVPFSETLNLAVGASAVHYIHVTQAAVVRSIAVALNGLAINSAANVVVTFDIVGGAVLGVVNLANGTTAGQGAAVTLAAPVALAANAVVRATTTTAATVAAGTGSCTLGLSLP